MDFLHGIAIAHDPAAVTSWGVVLHGIYGRGRNWTSVARQTSARRPEWGFWLADLRLHGESPPMAPPHTVARTAEDVAAFARHAVAAPGPRALLGHSFGGKVALIAAATLADSLRQVWIIDSTPETRHPGGSAWDMLEIVRSLPGPFGARPDAIAALEGRGLAPHVATWMATNLQRADHGLTWTLDLDALESMLRNFFTTDLWEVVEHPPGDVSLHFVKARESSTLSEAACTRIEAIARTTGRVHLHYVDGGHWVNAENPEALVELLARNLP